MALVTAHPPWYNFVNLSSRSTGMRLRVSFILIASLLLLLAACTACTQAEPQPAASSPSAETELPTPAPDADEDASASGTEMPAGSQEPAEVSEPTEEPAPEATAVPIPELTPEPAPEPSSEPAEEPAVTPPPTRDVSSYARIDLDSPALLGETEDMGQAYIDDIVFLGDSTTYGMKYYGVLSGGKDTTQVWTPSSGTLTLSYQSFATIVYPEDGSEITIREAVELKKPKMMVITLGVNGVSFMGRDEFISEYTDLVTDIMELSPDTKVIIQSIFPVCASYEYLGSINNEKICLANTWLLEVAEDTGAKYLNTISALMGDDGYMPEAYQNGDGLHLNTESFNIVLSYIRTHGWV